MKKFFFAAILILPAGFLVASIIAPASFSSGEQAVFLVERGEGSVEIARNLKQSGLIRWEAPFLIYVAIDNVARKLQAGTYLLSPDMNIPKIADKLAKGETTKEKITIIEGQDLKDIAALLEEKKMFIRADFSAALERDFSSEYEFLKDKPPSLGLEGYIFPDTYEADQKTSAEEFVRMALDNFDKKMTANLREEARNRNKKIFEIVTMASLIEKEVQTQNDKKIVSGILWKRLKSGMPLQVDATISYITGNKNGRVSIADTKIDSPYNTYKYKGLPLGPISNPGLDSIVAAIYPVESPYWYYLSAPGQEGGQPKTIFSKTLEEHNAAKAEYLK